MTAHSDATHKVQTGAGRRENGFAQRANGQGRRDTRSAVHVSVVIPTKNEAANIGWVLSRLPECVDEVIVVDGNSTDGTIDVARRVRPDVRVVQEERPGKGAALRTGFGVATGDFIAMIDADGSMDPAEIERCVAHLRDRRRPSAPGRYDLVKGSRFLRGGGTADMSPIRALGNDWLRRMVNVLYGVEWSDFCYGLIATRRDCIDALGLRRDGFEIEAEILLRAVDAGLKVGEVASLESPRLHGASNLNAWRDGRRVLRTILAERFVGDTPPADARPPSRHTSSPEPAQAIA
jgi:glycosyltransferase involved in cell wall biosynthesis